MLTLFFLFQAAATQAPDIELNVNLRARSMTIERAGEAKLKVRGEGPGNRVDVRVEPKAEGRTELRDVTVDLRVQASVEEGVKIDAEAETGTPQ